MQLKGVTFCAATGTLLSGCGKCFSVVYASICLAERVNIAKVEKNLSRYVL